MSEREQWLGQELADRMTCVEMDFAETAREFAAHLAAQRPTPAPTEES